MKRISVILFSLLAIFGSARADMMDVVSLVAEAQAAYERGEYESATSQFEQLSVAFNGSPDIYYALGNCYYKQQQFAQAILNYERCLKCDPAYEDAKTNLEMAQLNCPDKIEAIQPVIFVTWSNALRDSLSVNGWSNLSIGFFLAFLVCVACFFFLRKVVLRKTGFYGAVLMLVLFVVALFYAHAQNERRLSHDDAIVMAPTVTLRSTPAESGTQLLIIHEGVKVHIRQDLSGWSEVELSDGNVGWMPTSQLAVI